MVSVLSVCLSVCMHVCACMRFYFIGKYLYYQSVWYLLSQFFMGFKELEVISPNTLVCCVLDDVILFYVSGQYINLSWSQYVNVILQFLAITNRCYHTYWRRKGHKGHAVVMWKCCLASRKLEKKDQWVCVRVCWERERQDLEKHIHVYW